MAVRFLPPPGEPEREPGEDRADLAEVIELRGLLRQRTWGDPVAGEDPAASDPDVSGEAGLGTPSSGAWGAEPGDGGSEGQPDPHTDTDKAGERRAPEARRVRGLAVVSALGDRLTPASELERPATASRGPGAGSARDRVGEATAPSRTTPASAPLKRTQVAGDAVDTAPDPARTATEDGVRLLARRARSSGELREELLRLDHAPGDVDIVIDEFRESHYLDDLGLARTVTEKLRSSKGSSRSQIRIKLRDRRLPDAVIEEALGELDEDEEMRLLREAAVARAAKLGGLERQVAERRLLGFLARRGWSGERATRIAQEALDGRARGGGGVRFR